MASVLNTRPFHPNPDLRGNVALENTDKAVASILETIRQFSQQVQPDVFNSFANVAMLSAQQELVTAHICIWVASFLIGFGVLCMIAAVMADGGEGGAVISLVLFCGGLVMLLVNLSTVYSPLVEASAHDGKVALARVAIEKVEH